MCSVFCVRILFLILSQWSLIELAKNQSVQTKLREEITRQYRNEGDPTYDQLNSGLPYLDAVAHEVLRMHSGIWETIRVVRSISCHPRSDPSTLIPR
jgi:cytochrome P450